MPGQKNVFNYVLHAIHEKCNNKCIYLDGPGGSGKSYLLNTLITYSKKNNLHAVAIARSGIAANLLINDRTVHVIFQFPLDISKHTIRNIKPNLIKGLILKVAHLIIWDEITMTSKYAFEAVDRLFKDLTSNNDAFRGKTILIPGVFRQTLPFVKHGNRTLIIKNYIKKSYLWQKFKLFFYQKIYEWQKMNNNLKNGF